MFHPRPVGNPNLLGSQLLHVTNKFEELDVQVINAKIMRDQPVNDQANVWFTNCKGQKHMFKDCPSSLHLTPKCRFCDENHDISSCNE